MAIDIHKGYFTVLVPWIARPHATEWHPTEETGPFSVLTRGAFNTLVEAIAWARDHLGGAPYSIKTIPPEPYPLQINLSGMHSKLAEVCQMDRDIDVRRVTAEVQDSDNYGAKHEYTSHGDALALAVKSRDGYTRVYDCRVLRCATFAPDGTQLHIAD